MTNTDIALITRNSYNMGFEKGSTITLETVMKYLDTIDGSSFADAISIASQDGSLDKIRVDNIIQDKLKFNKLENVDPTELNPGPSIEIKREQARMSGYTGDECSECNNFTMVRNGTCLKCDSCGTTTGCS